MSKEKELLEKGLAPVFKTEEFGIGGIPPSEVIKHIEEQLRNGDKTKPELANKFPVAAFPEPIQNIIWSTRESLNFPVDYTGMALLFAASVAIGNTHKVEIKKGHRESAVIYVAIYGPPGTNKSHPLTFALGPITDQDRRTYFEFEQRQKIYARVQKMSKEEREEEGLDEPIKPVWQKYLLSDFTPEALADVHKFNKRGIGVYVDELASWFKNFNRYNNGSEMEFWLSAWSSKPINIDRKSGDPIFIPLPFISVAGTIQNGVLSELAKGRTQNGFIDRILFANPEDIKKECWSDSEIDPHIIERWNSIITNILSLTVRSDETLNPLPEVLNFSPEARLLLFAWEKDNADQCNNAENEGIAGLYSKLDMYVARLALILQILHWACEGDTRLPVGQVGVEAMHGAIKIIEYCRVVGVRVNSIISNYSPLDILPLDKRNLYNALPETFTTAQGLEVAAVLNIPADTFHKWLKRELTTLFKKLTKGLYQKRI